MRSEKKLTERHHYVAKNTSLQKLFQAASQRARATLRGLPMACVHRAGGGCQRTMVVCRSTSVAVVAPLCGAVVKGGRGGIQSEDNPQLLESGHLVGITKHWPLPLHRLKSTCAFADMVDVGVGGVRECDRCSLQTHTPSVALMSDPARRHMREHTMCCVRPRSDCVCCPHTSHHTREGQRDDANSMRNSTGMTLRREMV